MNERGIAAARKRVIAALAYEAKFARDPVIMIRAQIGAKGWTQRDLCACTKLSPAYVSDILSGKRRMSASAGLKIAVALDIPADDLVIAQALRDLDQARARFGDERKG